MSIISEIDRLMKKTQRDGLCLDMQELVLTVLKEKQVDMYYSYNSFSGQDFLHQLKDFRELL